jgi:hypothetical protein
MTFSHRRLIPEPNHNPQLSGLDPRIHNTGQQTNPVSRAIPTLADDPDRERSVVRAPKGCQSRGRSGGRLPARHTAASAAYPP